MNASFHRVIKEVDKPESSSKNSGWATSSTTQYQIQRLNNQSKRIKILICVYNKNTDPNQWKLV
jgi:hypothetical protein